MTAKPNTRIDVCPTHGDYESRWLVGTRWTVCTQCTAEAAQREADVEEAKKREARLQAWQRRIGEAGIPERFQSRTLANFIARTPAQKRALDFAQAYAESFDDVMKTGRSAAFVGRPGTGKTHLSAGIGLHVMRRSNRTVLFTSVLRAIRRIKESWRRDSDETETEAVAALVFPDLLILDEVGQQFGSDTEKLLLFDVLNERYEKRRPTLLLSNLPIDDYQEAGLTKPGLKAFLGERIVDRLREDGGEFVPFDWESNRGKTDGQ